MSSDDSCPLCVDMDGTLLKSDTMAEALVVFLRQYPFQIWRWLYWLRKGRAYFKKQLTHWSAIGVDLLPVSPAFWAFLEQEKSRGRQLFLVSGADEEMARRVAARFGIFAEVIASDGVTNLTGSKKAARLVARWGKGGFDYAGNHRVDLPVWRVARTAIVVNAPASLERRVKAELARVRVFDPQPGGWRRWSRVLRLHQWPKNVLLLVPALTGHRFQEPAVLGRVVLGLIGFCFCASSVYVVNDLLDLDSDRAHRTKRLRPFAGADVSIGAGLFLAPMLLLLALACAAWLPRNYGLFLLFYYGLSTVYSGFLKKVVLLDVFVLAALYTMRILAGHGATGIGYSNWLLGFSLFVFLSLALLKRSIELRRTETAGTRTLAGRGYSKSDLNLVVILGVVTGCLSALVLALYINSEEVRKLYRTPTLLLFICPLLLYWVARVWLLASRDELNDDPVVFALKDRVSYGVGALALVFIWLATVLSP